MDNGIREKREKKKIEKGERRRHGGDGRVPITVGGVREKAKGRVYEENNEESINSGR